ncbi:riboflavin biosynthesis protein RibF, partial [Ruminococcaceae bacterium OttesenSCG-928-O06]|nr:riboflavin biosynthesis protein RibF [Ruminococcaceae bacterium OttesenSCG-928-O06]
MKVIYTRQPVPATAPTSLALGFFDGVHLGHQEVIAAAKAEAEAKGLVLGVFTFVGSPRATKQVMTEAQKHRCLQELGVQACYQPPFESFRNLRPEEFFQQMLLEEYGAAALACGQNFGFGARRSGNVALLSRLCAEKGMPLAVLPLLEMGGAPVSSSRIRAALAAGDVEEAATLLGRPFEIEAPVQHGKALGGRLGFPTLNQVFPEEIQPPAFGVYITKAWVDGTWWPAATGWGTRPTVDGEGATCETFIPDFVGNL